MTMYTLDDIQNDIKMFEGVYVDLTDNGSKRNSSVFFMLYSEYYGNAQKNDGTVNDLRQKVIKFVSDPRYHLPNPDTVPEDNEKYIWLYAFDSNDQSTKLVETFKSEEDFLDNVSGKKYNEHNELLIVDSREGQIYPANPTSDQSEVVIQ